MPEESLHPELLLRFVLGTASESEQMRIEEACFTDPDRQQELWAVFDEVAERFWQGDLTPIETRQFALRLQASPLLYERAKQLQALLDALPTTAAMPVVQTEPSFWSRWRGLTWWQVGLPATALLLVMGSVIWWSRIPSAPVSIARQEPPSPRPTDNPAGPLPTLSTVPYSSPKPKVSPPMKSSPPIATPTTFFLMQKTVRDMDTIIPLPITPRTQTLALQMEIRKPLYPRYQVTVQSSDGHLHTIPNLRPRLYQGQWLLTIQLSVATVTVEPFTVQIQGLPSQQEPILVGTHVLRVQRK